MGRERRARRGEQRAQKPKDKRRISGNMSMEFHRREDSMHKKGFAEFLKFDPINAQKR